MNCSLNLKIRDLLKQNSELQKRNTELVLENRKLRENNNTNNFCKVYVSYSKYDILITALTQHLLTKHKKYNFDIIIAPPRGALPIATHISHQLNVNYIETNIKYLFENDLSQYKILIIDDIVDTGLTMKFIIDGINNTNIYTSSLFYKPHSNFCPDFYVYKTQDWIVFPWEKWDEKPNREMYKEL